MCRSHPPLAVNTQAGLLKSLKNCGACDAFACAISPGRLIPGQGSASYSHVVVVAQYSLFRSQQEERAKQSTTHHSVFDKASSQGAVKASSGRGFLVEAPLESSSAAQNSGGHLFSPSLHPRRQHQAVYPAKDGGGENSCGRWQNPFVGGYGVEIQSYSSKSL